VTVGEPPGAGAPGDALDLDRLIGELETEGARRRAAPDYPHDREARLHLELERLAPHPAGPAGIDDLLAGLERAVAALADAAAGDVAEGDRRGGRSRRAAALGRRLRRLEGAVAAEGLAVAAAVRALRDALADLEARTARAGNGEAAATGAPVGTTSPDDGEALGDWRARLADAVAPGGGRVLYHGVDADAVVGELRAAGVDAYGVTDVGPQQRPGPDVRHGELLAHLRAVGDGALGAVVVTGVPDAMTADVLGPLVDELARTAASVVVVSLAPWWWRRRLGAPDADLAPARPFDPDTWLASFDRRGLHGSAQYGPGGRSYRLVVGTGP